MKTGCFSLLFVCLFSNYNSDEGEEDEEREKEKEGKENTEKDGEEEEQGRSPLVAHTQLYKPLCEKK